MKSYGMNALWKPAAEAKSSSLGWVGYGGEWVNGCEWFRVGWVTRKEVG